MTESVRLTVPPVFTHNSFEYFLGQLPEGLSAGGCCVFDFRVVTGMTAFGVLSLLILCETLSSLGIKVSVDSRDNQPVKDMLAQWGFSQFFPQEEGAVSGQGHSSRIVLPITPIQGEQDVYEVISALRDSIPMSPRQATDLVVVVSEIAQNIMEHSSAKGYIAVGRHRRRARQDMVDICVADGGVGMGQSLKEKLAYVDRRYLDSFAIYKALYEGLSRHDEPGRGNGIVKTRELVRKHGGRLSLRSGRAKIWGTVSFWQIERVLKKQLCFLPGTQVHIEFPLSRELPQYAEELNLDTSPA
ncbi:MAG: hypothetical protein GF333_04955 [Candidatus Omnitrophica bacterium]|nr:hypothetical protein [Candidatus Omnitrophota bacterium]